MNAVLLRRASACVLAAALAASVLLAYLQPSGIAALMQLMAFCR